MRYRHKNTGEIYESRGDVYPDPFTGTLKRPVYNVRYMSNVVVYAENLEPIEDIETLKEALREATKQPKSREDYLDLRAEVLVQRAMQIAGELTFHLGNAILAIVDGDLGTAQRAIQMEVDRRYREPDPATDERPEQ